MEGQHWSEPEEHWSSARRSRGLLRQSDSSAAGAFVQRKGLGRQKRVHVRWLWVRATVRRLDRDSIVKRGVSWRLLDKQSACRRNKGSADTNRPLSLQHERPKTLEPKPPNLVCKTGFRNEQMSFRRYCMRVELC
eukprot:127794-Amphidinium_carterae.1